MSESMENQPPIPNMHFDGAKDGDVYEINLSVILIIVVVLLLVSGILFWKFKGSNNIVQVVPTPIPTEVTLAPTSTSTNTPTPTPGKNATPTPSAKQKVKLQVLNGTGVAGDAAFLKSKLVSDGFENIDAGNADNVSTDAKTTVTYYGTFPSSLKPGLTSLLNDLYASVSASIASDSGAGKFDAVIVTGKKK